MKSPKNKPGPEPPESGGGKALRRLEQFQAQRGIVPDSPVKKPSAPRKSPRRKAP